MISAIVCVNNDWAIGKNGGLLYKLDKDMAYFKTNTLNKIVVCGENTLLSFPKSRPLKNRTTIVLCPEEHEYENCICIHNFEYLVNMVKCLSITNDVFIIGGGMLYRSMLPYYDKIYVTKVDSSDQDATVFFPNLDTDTNFKLSKESEVLEDNGYNIKFCYYERVSQ